MVSSVPYNKWVLGSYGGWVFSLCLHRFSMRAPLSHAIVKTKQKKHPLLSLSMSADGLLT